MNRRALDAHQTKIPNTTSVQGFTLVEVIVSLGLFAISMVIAITALYTVNAAAKKVESMRVVLDNLDFAVESMSRTIRTGIDINCGGFANTSSEHNCPFVAGGGSTTLSLESTLGTAQNVEYYLDANAHTIMKETAPLTTGSGGQGQIVSFSTPVALTDPAITISTLTFYVNGADTAAGGNDDHAQPSVIIRMVGTATTDGDTTPFVIQTYVSQRSVE